MKDIETIKLIINIYNELQDKAKEIAKYYIYNYCNISTGFLISIEIIFSNELNNVFNFQFDVCERDTSYIVKTSSGNLPLYLMASDLKNFIEK